MPRLEFREAQYSGYEGDGEVTAWITRRGDLSHHASVRCFTRQGSALVTDDFEERPDTVTSTVHFLPGEQERPCKVIVVNDHLHEEDEQLHLVLGSPASPTAGGAHLGTLDRSTIFIKDKADRSTVGLEESRYIVEEPERAGEERLVKLGVVRGGDTSSSVSLRLHTKDSSATSGKDYFPLSQEVVFAPNVSRVEMGVTVLGDSEKEPREAFTVHLKPLRGSSTAITTSKAIVYIEEMDSVASVTFPAPPVVVSLRDYDEVSTAPVPIPGYPLVCVTACNSRHPQYRKTGGLCEREGINDTLTTYHWKVGAPAHLHEMHNNLKDVTSDTFFTSTRGITLDSIYFFPGSRVQCLARAHSSEGKAGQELASIPMTVASRDAGFCPPSPVGTFGADPFTAKLHYTGTGDPSHPNMVRVEVVIPHRDGMIPVLSTRPLNSFRLTLSRDGIRIGNHRCSNLLDFHEARTKYGFLTNQTRRSDGAEELEPYQHSSSLRSLPTLRFYRALAVESCMWKWVGHYTMSELVTQCGGEVTADGEVLDAVQSFVSIQVPLYVSCVSYSPMAAGGWQHTDLSTQLRLSFVYDTAILWHQGIRATVESELAGVLYPTSMKLAQDGRLVVTCRTQPRFLGVFLEEHTASDFRSSVTSDDHPDLTFTLQLLTSQPTYTHPEQHWQFVSDLAVRDYSGSYVVHLLPCTVTEDQVYALPLVCNPGNLISFDLKVRFQQVSDPVPEQFTLNTLFHLTSQRNLWLSNLTSDFDTQSVSFYPGDRIYGRVMIAPVQALGAGFHITLEKVFLCTGVDGYVPKYNPDTDEYGCVADSANLLHNFKIIDREAPASVQLYYKEEKFNAHLADHDPHPDVVVLQQQPDADGFSLDSSPLFQVFHGHQWFVHCIYTVNSEETAAAGITKRDLSTQGDFYHLPTTTKEDSPWIENFNHISKTFGRGHHFRKSETIEADGIFIPFESGHKETRVKRTYAEKIPTGSMGSGTNMHRLSLRLPQHKWDPSLSDQDSEFSVLAVMVTLMAVVVVTTIIAMVLIRGRRGQASTPSGYVTVAATSKASNYAFHSRYLCEESTEV